MSIQKVVERFCVQTAVYWGNPVNNGVRIVYDTPVEIACRWSPKVQVMTDGKGKEFISRAHVLLTADVNEDGFLYLGTLSDLDSDPNPLEVSRAFRIRLFGYTFMPRSTTDRVRVAYL